MEWLQKSWVPCGATPPPGVTTNRWPKGCERGLQESPRQWGTGGCGGGSDLNIWVKKVLPLELSVMPIKWIWTPFLPRTSFCNPGLSVYRWEALAIQVSPSQGPARGIFHLGSSGALVATEAAKSLSKEGPCPTPRRMHTWHFTWSGHTIQQGARHMIATKHITNEACVPLVCWPLHPSDFQGQWRY